MAKILKDGTGTYNLDAVVAITPKKIGSGKDAQDMATLHFVGGANIDTGTAYDDAVDQFGGSSKPSGQGQATK